MDREPIASRASALLALGFEGGLELDLFLSQKAKQRLPLGFILLRSQQLLEMVNIGPGDVLIHVLVSLRSYLALRNGRAALDPPWANNIASS
jgi:hypothetical protein